MTVDLCGPGVRKGFLKAILGKYGRDLAGLSDHEGISEVKLNLGVQTRTLAISGAVEQVDQVYRKIFNRYS